MTERCLPNRGKSKEPRASASFANATRSTWGLTLVAAGLLLMTGVSESGGLTLVLSGTVVGEAGFMLPNVSLRIAATGGADRDERGLVAGLLNT